MSICENSLINTYNILTSKYNSLNSQKTRIKNIFVILLDITDYIYSPFIVNTNLLLQFDFSQSGIYSKRSTQIRTVNIKVQAFTMKYYLMINYSSYSTDIRKRGTNKKDHAALKCIYFSNSEKQLKIYPPKHLTIALKRNLTF